MKKIITNTSDSPMYVAGQMVPPGESVEVEVPDEATSPAEAPAPTLADEVAELLKKSVKELVAELPSLSSDTLDMMDVLEGGKKDPRSTLVTAIKTEQMRRADQKMESGIGDAAGDLVQAQNDLAVAKDALEANGDADAHASLTDAVDHCQKRVDALTAAMPTVE